MNDIMKIVQALEESNILLRGVTKTSENETKEQKEGFLSMLLGTLCAGLLGNLLTGKGIERAGSGRLLSSALQNNKVKGIIKTGYGNQSKKCNGFLIKPHPLTNFEIQKYYENESRFNGVFSRDNLPKKIKDGVNVINLDEHADTATHWIALFCKNNEIVYFDSIGVEHIPEEIKEFIGNKNIKGNIF